MRVDDIQIIGDSAVSTTNTLISVNANTSSDFKLSLEAGEDIQAGNCVGIAGQKFYKYHEWRNRQVTASGVLFNPGGAASAQTLKAFMLYNDPTRFITVYHRSTSIFAAVSQLSGDAVVTGSTATLITSATNGEYLKIVPDTSVANRYFLVVRPTDTTNSSVVMFDISGLSISLVGSQTSLTKAGFYLCQLDTNKYLMCTHAIGANKLGYVLTWNPGSNTWSVGANGGIVGDDPDNEETLAFRYSPTLVYTNDADLGWRAVTISGTTVTTVFDSNTEKFNYNSSQIRSLYPGVVKSGDDFYVYARKTETPTDYGNFTLASYNRVVSGTTTVAERYSGVIDIGGVDNPYAGFTTYTDTTEFYFQPSAQQIIYDPSNPYNPRVQVPSSNARVTINTDDYFTYVIQTDPFVEPIGLYAYSSVANGTNNFSSVVLGQQRNRFVHIFYDGTDIRYSMYELFKPSEFNGIATTSVNSGEILEVVVRGNYTLPTPEPLNEGKFLQIFDGEIYPSSCEYASIGIHKGDSYFITGRRSSIQSGKTTQNHHALIIANSSLAAGVVTKTPDSYYEVFIASADLATEQFYGILLFYLDDDGVYRVFSHMDITSRAKKGFFIRYLPAECTIINTGTVPIECRSKTWR